MQFAEADVSGNTVALVLGALGAFVSVVVTGAVTAYKVWRKTRDESAKNDHAIRLESDAASLSHFESVIRYLQGELVRGQADRERAAAHVGELQQAFDEMREEHGECRVQLEALYGITARLYDDAARRLRERGLSPPDVEGELGARPERPLRQIDASRIESRARELQQGTQALQAQARGGETHGDGGGQP